MARIMAFDYGKRRTGIAVTDPSQIIATGLTTVETDKVLEFVKSYTQQEQVEKFVVGYPLSLSGDATDATPLVDSFIGNLKKNFPRIPIHKNDERYTSKMAMQTLVASGVKKKARRNKALLDEVSAVIILQDYMGIEPM